MVGNESWNRYVFRRLQKTGSVGAEVTSCGKLFQSLLSVCNSTAEYRQNTVKLNNHSISSGFAMVPPICRAEAPYKVK